MSAHINVVENGRSQIFVAIVAMMLIPLSLWVLPTPVASIAVALLPIALLLSIRQPFLMCVLFITFSYFRIHEAYPYLYPLRLPQALGTLSVFAFIWHVLLTRSIKPFWPRELKLFCIFFALTTLETVLATDTNVAFAYWSSTYWKIGIMTLAIAWLARTVGDFSLAVRAFVITGCSIALMVIYNQIGGIGLVGTGRTAIGYGVDLKQINESFLVSLVSFPSDPHDAKNDFSAILGDPNDLALLLLLPLAFAAGFLVHRAGFMNVSLGIMGVPITTWAILATKSRGGLIGLVAVLAVIGLRVFKSKVLLCTFLVVSTVGFYAIAGIAERTDYGGDVDGIAETTMGRIDAWRAALKMALTRPLTGVGIDNYGENFSAFTEFWRKRDVAVHSTWFNVLAETGFPGIVTFMIMVITCFASSVRNLVVLTRGGAPPVVCAMALGVLAGFAGFCAAGTFLTHGFTWPIYILVALTVAIARFTKNHGSAHVPIGLKLSCGPNSECSRKPGDGTNSGAATKWQGASSYGKTGLRFSRGSAESQTLRAGGFTSGRTIQRNRASGYSSSV
jgi:hypothetical protein